MIFPEIFAPYRKDIFAGFVGDPYDFDWNPEKTDFRQDISEFLEENFLSPDYILNPDQTHSTIIYFSNFSNFSCFSKEKKYQKKYKKIIQKISGDGVSTHEKNILCVAKHADCIGAIFYHPELKIGATIHAGWRGLAQKIFSEYLKNFSKQEISGFLVALSPSLGPCCAEFSDPYHETPEFFHQFISTKTEKYYVNLWGIASEELQKMGVPQENIELPTCCTKCNKTPEGEIFPKNFWSHRNKDIQRNASFFMNYDLLSLRQAQSPHCPLF